MPDLLLVVPSRGRPRNIARLLDSVRETARLDTRLHVAVDEDDETLPQYEAVMARAGRDGDRLETGPRKGLCARTNEVALGRAGEFPFLASLGDDHVPRTPGWDEALVRAITGMGGTGFAWPWDGTSETVPEACVMSSGIVAALGWMCLPGLEHWYGDNVWADLGKGAGCIAHLRAVAVDHVHPRARKAAGDATYAGNGKSLEADRAAYCAWRASGMAADVATVLALRERVPQPA